MKVRRAATFAPAERCGGMTAQRAVRARPCPSLPMAKRARQRGEVR